MDRVEHHGDLQGSDYGGLGGGAAKELDGSGKAAAMEAPRELHLASNEIGKHNGT
jgi:hypothetical protein